MAKNGDDYVTYREFKSSIKNLSSRIKEMKNNDLVHIQSSIDKNHKEAQLSMKEMRNDMDDIRKDIKKLFIWFAIIFSTVFGGTQAIRFILGG